MSAPIRLQTHVWNPLGDRRALLLHGLTSDGTCWWRLASDLAEAGWMVLAPDLRSHGRSPTAADHAISALASDVALLGDGYELVVGHSLGGAVAASLLTAPGYAHAAVLLDPLLWLDEPDREPLRRSLRAETGALDAAALRSEHPTWDERDVQRKVLAAALVTPDVVDLVFAHNDPWDLRPDVRRSAARTHIVLADPERGGLLTEAVAAPLVDGRRITSERLEGVGHSVHRERPDLLRAAIDHVLDAQPAWREA